MANDGVIAALEAALAADPSADDVRLHLAGLLVDAGRAEEAVAHVGSLLAGAPDDVAVLRLAARACSGAGDEDKAARYRRMADALSGGAASAADAAVPDPDAAMTHPELVGVSDTAGMSDLGGDLGDDVEGELDAFLRDVLAEDVERPAVTLADVGGLEEVKRRLNTSFLGPLKNEELRRMYGKSLQGGLLLWGPPGCGKTFLARAVAGELGAHFYSVGLHDVLDMWLGNSEQNVHTIFETARRNAPCVLFLDEVDALGMKRSNLTQSAGRGVVVQLLSEMDGARNENEGVFVLAATNQPWDVDPALRRPGRLDRQLLVLPPDRAARRSILEFHLRERPVGRVDLEGVATATEGFSGADLRLTCESAAEHALEASLESGQARPISAGDFERALAEVRPSTRPWFDMARNYAVYANEGGDYDGLLDYMRRHKLS